MTPSALADFRSRIPDCELAIYVDIGSRTVLGADSTLRYPQEYLDALCACAAEFFGADPEFDGSPIGEAVFLSSTGGRAFLRAPNDPAEALCCICAPQTDFDQILAVGRNALNSSGTST